MNTHTFHFSFYDAVTDTITEEKIEVGIDELTADTIAGYVAAASGVDAVGEGNITLFVGLDSQNMANAMERVKAVLQAFNLPTVA